MERAHDRKSAPPPTPRVTSSERSALGKSLRDGVPRSSHARWCAPPERVDPLTILRAAGRGRVSRLIPLRNARMAESPFAFFRGTAAVMAADLAYTPVSGPRVQLCGDAHCLNFGAFATPERRLIFDVTDFDETLPGPWEWDIKRLAVSLVLAARTIKLEDVGASVAVSAAVRAYRTKLAESGAQTLLETWYARIDAAQLVPPSDRADRRKRKQIVASAEAHSMRAAVEKITVATADGRRFRDEPPLLYHSAGQFDGGFDVERVFATYPQTLAPEVRALFRRYRLVDHAIKVVGVGSIGTRCSVALFEADPADLLVLQIKQAQASVLEPYVGTSEFPNHGERVVFGQRLMQAASDTFLGWGTSGEHDFYVRQFKDKKGRVDIDAMDGYGLRDYAAMCGSVLAGAHARSGDAAQIAGYLGKSDTFDESLVTFALAYAEQVERDFETFRTAIAAGSVGL